MATGGDNPFLPREIIINILKRLPVKTLTQFQSVCKDWKNLFKNPHFIAEHYHYSAHKNPLLIFHAFGCSRKYSPLCLLRYKMESVEVERIPSMHCLRRACGIIGSCNGLLCVILGYNVDGSPPLLLLNPATREVRQVPRTINDDGGYGNFGWGFGFSPVARDYKIVRIHSAISINSQINLDNICVDGVEVYSLRTGSWKEVEFGAIWNVRFQSRPVTVNGAMYWLGLEGEDHRHMVVSFDLAMEVFTTIPIPSSISDACTYTCVLNVYENKLAMLYGHYDNKSAFIDLWVLEEGSGACGKSWDWTKKYRFGPTSCSLYPICFWRNEIVCKNSAFHLFNLTANELKKFHILFNVDDTNVIFNYVESLVSMCD